ncbi:uncharacterized protein LOC100678558 isoform X2 [Nasonia vitripennis]|uniref:Uncharacterized protein n=1 Tax=Nasonia vitripennis TaxID=7425 RepID=A0A7M7QCT3_NASVI|nr:uncharacterized protein LOC100678558 isoform X2 [Nasonia vitripennis]
MGEVERYATSKNIDKRHREAPFCEVHRVVYEAAVAFSRPDAPRLTEGNKEDHLARSLKHR